MSTHNFLSYFQQLLTMVESGNPYSVALARTALNTTVEMARLSRQSDEKTLRLMMKVQSQFDYFLQHRKEYMRIPDNHEENSKRRRMISKKFSREQF